MTSFLARTFGALAHKPATICAVLATSCKMMNSSTVPVTLSTDETWDPLCSKQPETERKLLQLFSIFSDTMQFTEKLRIQNKHRGEDLVKGVLERLIMKRYFSRTIRHLELPFPNDLINACCSLDHSSTTTTPTIFSNLRSLSVLRGDYFALENEQLKAICSHCPFLETLNIPRQQQLTDEGLELVSILNHLKKLDLYYLKITDDGLQHLAKISCLQSLDLMFCNQITDSGLGHLAKLSSLQTLNLGYCSSITDSGLENLAKLSSLQTLNLEYCQLITDSGLEHLAKLPSLQSLNLGCCNKITDSGLQHLAKLSALQSLKLDYCNEITDSGIENLAGLPSLRLLTLGRCFKITDDGRRVFSPFTKVCC